MEALVASAADTLAEVEAASVVDAAPGQPATAVRLLVTWHIITSRVLIIAGGGYGHMSRDCTQGQKCYNCKLLITIVAHLLTAFRRWRGRTSEQRLPRGDSGARLLQVQAAWPRTGSLPQLKSFDRCTHHNFLDINMHRLANEQC